MGSLFQGVPTKIVHKALDSGQPYKVVRQYWDKVDKEREYATLLTTCSRNASNIALLMKEREEGFRKYYQELIRQFPAETRNQGFSAWERYENLDGFIGHSGAHMITERLWVNGKLTNHGWYAFLREHFLHSEIFIRKDERGNPEVCLIIQQKTLWEGK